MRSLISTAILMFATQTDTISATAIYAVTKAGSLYQSTDAAKTWQQIPLPGIQPTTFTSALAIDPQNPANIYIALMQTTPPGKGSATGDPLQRTFLRTSNGGQSWAQSDLPATTNFTRLVVDPASPNVIYAMTGGTIYRSTDSGGTFNNAGLSVGIADIWPDPNRAGAFYASGIDSTRNAALQKTVDSGATWTPVTAPGLPNSRFLTVRSLAVDPHNASNIYAAMGGGCPAAVPNCGLLRSSDGAKTWSAVNVPGDFYNVVFDPRNSDVYAAGWITTGTAKGHVSRSSDGGKTWSTLDTGLPAYPVRLYLDPNVSVNLYAAPDPAVGVTVPSPATVYVSTNSGSAWTANTVAAQMAPNDVLVSLGVTSGNAAAPPPGPPAGSVTRTVSAASQQDGPVAAESIVIATGTRLATGPATADYDQPSPALAGTTVNVTDSAGVSRPALLFSVSATQVMYQIPPGTAPGTATVKITAGDGIVTTAQIQIATVAPGLFTINQAGLAKGYVVRLSNGNYFVEDVFDIDATGAMVARPITVSNGDQVTLILYGTGFRAAGGDFSATAGGVGAPVLYAGPQGVQPGLDQVNLMIPPQVATGGAQSIPVVLTAAGQTANTVYVTVQ
jgi:uncharacterized protein (TIGR03437 family)